MRMTSSGKPPASDSTAGRPARARPRNFLSPSERHRLFWLVMPPALSLFLLLSWYERPWDRPLPAATPQIDTLLRSANVDRRIEDSVIIEADPEPVTAPAEDLGATPESLASVRDDTVFRPGDDEAWFQIWQTLRSTGSEALRRSGARRVGFAELFGQPRSFRGRLIRFRGTIHRLQKVEAPPNGYDIEGYWQAWIEPDGGPASPIVVYFLDIPDGMPHGMKVCESVDVVGYFFKRWAYQASDAIRTAPLVMAAEPIWNRQSAAAPGGTLAGGLALAGIAAVVATTVAAMWLTNGRRERRPAGPDVDLSAALSGIETLTPQESLRRLEAEAASPKPGPAEPWS